MWPVTKMRPALANIDNMLRSITLEGWLGSTAPRRTVSAAALCAP
jgi:hypothetical protein